MVNQVNNSETQSLEALISKISFAIVNEGILDENEINKLLGVLSNDGVYAMWVYAISKLDTSFRILDNGEIRKAQTYKLIFELKDLPLFRELDISSFEGDIQKKQREIVNKFEEINKNPSYNERRKKEEIKNIKKQYLRELAILSRNFIKKISEYFQNIVQDITKLLFLKQLLEKTLIYARYHAKALEGSNE